MSNKLDRRKFIGALSLGGAGLAVGIPHFAKASDVKPAILGGPKAHPGSFPTWPMFDQTEEKALTDVLKSRIWGRAGGPTVTRFQTEYGKLLGAKHCLGVSSGTSSLYTMLGALDIGPGDEVVIPVYTFIATYNVVTLNYALPVMVDTDLSSFQMDTGKIEAAVNPQTKVIMPVHMGGSPADLDRIMEISRKVNVPVIEDACQAPLAEWRGRKVGTFGLGGGFSFQASKNINAGEGGAITTNDEQFARYCNNFHNQGMSGRAKTDYEDGGGTRATNMRLTEFQSGVLLAQMTRLIEQANQRNENANYLTSLLKDIPGIMPAKLYDGVTRSAYHLYMFRYDRKHFADLSRERFMDALRAEGVPCSRGYATMNTDKYVTELANNKHYLKIYGEKKMKAWLEQSKFPQNDLLSEQQGVWFTQNLLLGTKTQMEQIAEGIKKIRKHAAELTKS
ncbi:MAG: DegT/DnrJ/EryC1/StrS family aminotransferase [Cyclobacteriaceae bacterium]